MSGSQTRMLFNLPPLNLPVITAILVSESILIFRRISMALSY